MRAVWSFWTKPFRQHREAFWVSEKQHLLSWILSLETARQHYPETLLVTDDAGARLLVDGLGLPFSQVSTELNALDRADPEWWALGKLYTYRLQTAPFLHIDSDVFLWKPLPAHLENSALLAQNPEYFTAGLFHYSPEAFESAFQQSGEGWLPSEWHWYRRRSQQRGECCGILGGHDLDFIHYYADLAMQIVSHPANQKGWQLLGDKQPYMTLLEQYLLAACVDYHSHHAAPDHTSSSDRPIQMQYLFNSVEELFDPTYAAKLGFTHLMGAKQERACADRIQQRVQEDYPEAYDRCISALQNLGINFF